MRIVWVGGSGVVSWLRPSLEVSTGLHQNPGWGQRLGPLQRDSPRGLVLLGIGPTVMDTNRWLGDAEGLGSGLNSKADKCTPGGLCQWVDLQPPEEAPPLEPWGDPADCPGRGPSPWDGREPALRLLAAITGYL